MPSKCLYEYVIKEKKPHYVERHGKDAKANSVCDECEGKEGCKEFATIGYPIISEDQVIGVIGINVFEEEKCNRISTDFYSMINFLDRLSSLLLGNMHYLETINKLQIQKEETNHIMNSLSNGVLCVDNEGTIKYINEKGKKLLHLKNEDNKVNIKDIIKDLKLEALFKGCHSSVMEVHNIKNSTLMLKSKPITLQGEKVSTIIQITKKSDEMRNAYNLFINSKEVNFEDIIGDSKAINKVKSLAQNIAKTDATVLLQGESGTGKELFARAIHFESPRLKAPFIAINCASIPDNLLESEFFGYEGGTFTGARKEGHTGKFELANGGTIFLDEIGDLPLHLQPKILRVLQEQSFTKIGGKEEITVDVRIIAATNRNLKDMVEKGRFREDLYYRLNVIPIMIPTLKEREEDIYLLSSYLLDKYCTKYDMEIKELSKEVKDIFKDYKWPGNVRELENVIEYLVSISKDATITCSSLPEAFKDSNIKTNKCTMSLKSRVDHYERNLLRDMLEEYGEDAKGKSIICDKLSIDLSTLYRKLNKYNLQ